jgi:CHAD domain-containing protein
MNHMFTISLTDEEKQKLVELSQTAPHILIHRARLILAYAEGKPTMLASMEAGISRGRARFWKRQFLAKGMEIFRQDSVKETTSMEKPRQTINHSAEELLEEPVSIETREADATHRMEIPYPKPRQFIGVNLDDTMAEAGKKVWLYYFAEMLGHEEGTLLGENVEELHDMRVATRRMRTAFDIFSPAFDPKTMKRHIKGLRTIGRVLGQVRDMDVILENAITYQMKMKSNARLGVEPLLNNWKGTIDRQRTKLIKHLQSEAYHNFKQNFNIFLQVSDNIKAHGTQNDGTNSQVRDTVPVLVYSRYAAVRAYESILPTASVSQLHALRIEFKKFRYTLEYFREILGDGANQAIDELKQLQDHLGELHDADVACQLIRNFLKDWDEEQIHKPISERLNPAPIVIYLAYLHAERYRLIRTYPELWRKFSRPEFRQNIAQAISLL